ncbi:MAG: FG-GAP-like repeat-containing protein, partial [Candidatus Kariarchaeaceae archaeon]
MANTSPQTNGLSLKHLSWYRTTKLILLNIAMILLLSSGNVVAIGAPSGGVSEPTIQALPELPDTTDLLPDFSVTPDSFPTENAFVDEDVDIIDKLRDNDNSYTEIYNPWKTRAANHVAAVTEDGEYMAVGGGFLLDTEIHIYRWNTENEEYEKVSEAGSGEIKGDIYDLAFDDLDNNGLLDLAAVSGDGFLYVFEQESLYDPFLSLENRFELVWKSEKLFQAKSVDIFDTDLDGIKDIIVGSWDSKVHVYEYVDHSGYPFAREHWIEFEETWVSEELEGKVESVETGDFNGNGLPDIIAGTFTGELYIFENDGLLVPSPTGGLVPLPNDDDYVQIWSQTGAEKSIWKTIGNIEAEDVDGDGLTDAVILGWGQGSWVLRYTNERSFYLEQLMVPFESWEAQGFYPLDYFGDRMVVNTDDPFTTATNLFVDTPSRSQPSCTVIEEPTGDGSCYNVLTNSAVTDAPDGVYTEFRPNSTHTAFGVWDTGVGEELATNGNSDPDLYIVMKSGQVTPSDWNITLSNDLTDWYSIDPAHFSVTSGSEGDALAVNLDVVFSQRQIESMRYLRLELINQNADGDVDGFIIPYPARPLTLAVSANIYPLNFLEDGFFVAPSNKIIFGGTDGRLIVFDKIQQTDLSIRDKSSISNTVTIEDSDYGLSLQSWSQKYDTYKDDQFKTDETIWSIYPTPKGTVIPIWRYYAGGGMDDFSISNIGGGTEKAHFMQAKDVHPFYSGTELVVSSNATSELFVFSDFYGNSPTDVASLSNLFFAQINAYNFDIGGAKILTFAFGEFDSDHFLEEIITFAWYRDPTTLGQDLPYDQYLLPILWKWDGSNYGNQAPIIDKTDQLYSFIASSVTYPSADTGDFNGDGLVDIVISNGRLAMLWNVGTAANPEFEMDLQYFDTLNDRAVSLPIYQPNAWDYDEDGDMDILYSYGRDNSSRQRYGLDFFENLGSAEAPDYERTPEIVKNPSLTGSFFANDYTYGTVDTDTVSDASAYALWVYNPETHRVRQAFGEIGAETSFIVGSNPEIKKLEINKAQTDFFRNYGYTVTESWNNRYEYADWTVTLETGELDGDDTMEIVISDFDNNVYVFENLVNNTYKRAFKTFDLNHTVTSDTTPYFYEELEGLQGKFSRSIFDHGTELIVDIDFNGNGRDEFIVIADLSIYIFENTGFNDAYDLIFERAYDQEVAISDTTWDNYVDEFSAIAYTDDYDGRGPMIALGADFQLFLLRYSPDVGFIETFATIDNQYGILDMIGTPSYPYSQNHIDVLRFADVNQDGQTELWAGGYVTQLFSDVRNGFLVAIESNYSDFSTVYEFSSEFTTSNPVNTLEFDDLDYDGQLEMIIGHSFGVDIYEAAIGSSYDFTKISVISSDPGYAATEAAETFGSLNSAQALGARKHDMLRLSNGNYIVVMGRDQISSNSFAPFFGTPTSGELYFTITSNPETTDFADYTSRVGSDPLTTGVISSGWERVVIWESDPKIIESGSPGSFYITWVSAATYYFNDVLQYSGMPYYNVHIAEFNSVGALIASKVLSQSGYSFLFNSPTIALQPSDPEDLLFAFTFYDIFVIYDINFDAAGTTLSAQSGRSNYNLLLEYYFHSVDIISDPSSGRIGLSFSARPWNGATTNKIFYAEYTDEVQLSDFVGIWQLNSDRTQETNPSILAMPDDPSNLIILYERVTGAVHRVATSFSNDNGRSWSEYFTGFTENPNLFKLDDLRYQTPEGITVYPSQYSPQMTINENGQIEYQYVERFAVDATSGGDSNYAGISFSITFFGYTASYQFASQMFTATFENSNFFGYQGISNVRDIAIGDSDGDGRKELFLSHGNQVSL